MTDVEQHPLRRAYLEHGPAVHRVAAHICGVRLAPDVSQEVFLRFWQNPDAYVPARGTLRSFLVASARSRAIDAVRSEQARQAREHRVAAESVSPTEVDEVLLRREQSNLVHEAIQRLPSTERDAIVTAFYGECTYREAAVILGASEGTIKSRIRAGLARLHDQLTQPAPTASAPA